MVVEQEIKARPPSSRRTRRSNRPALEAVQGLKTIGIKDMKKAYSLKPFYKITYSIYAVLALVYVFLKFKGLVFGSSDWLSNILVIGWAVIGVAFLYNAIFKKLIISELGIEYRAFSQHFFLAWNQVEEIPARLSFKVLIGKSSNGRKLIISLYQFKDDPINSDLGQQIKQYAPHLFEKENKQSV